MHVSEDTLVQWMNFIRYGLSGGLVHTNRFLECFWDSQLKSKRWVVDNFPDEEHGPVFIFGGWYGTMAHLLDDNKMITNIFSIDIDPDCIADARMHFPRENIEYVFSDMCEYEYVEKPSVVINTSTEHVNDLTYKKWWDRIPEGTTVILQGNDLVIDEHVRPFKDIDDFETRSLCEKITKQNITHCDGPNNTTYQRFSLIGYK
tara:strand:- start:5872 stop:6480 length:609 start_codon:yes stop_codon:yes gene_type:complete